MKPCKHCATPFTPVRPLQAVCSALCASRLVKAERKAEIATTRARKQALKTIPQLIKEAQIAVNAYVRQRDKDKGCFVCGKPFDFSDTLGGVMDAGHFRGRGAAPQHRFNELNIMGECKPCNSSWGAKPHEVREGAIRRIGLKAVEALEADNAPHKWTREELENVKNFYKTKLKALQAQQSTNVD